MKSIRILVLQLSFWIIPCALWAQGIIVSGIKGTVEYRLTTSAPWQPAMVGVHIPQSGAIRTSDKSRALLIFPNGSKIWLKPNTNLEIKQHAELTSELSLLSGSIKTRVPHIKRKEIFKIKTPTALAAVRGTEFVMDADEQGETSMDVLFGEIKLEVTQKDTGVILKILTVNQGLSYLDGKFIVLTVEKELAGLENWSPEVPDEKRRDDLNKRSEERHEISQFVSQAKETENEVREFVQRVKEDDFAVGRTLVDVHGNVVRVDQRLDRPDNKTIQLINVVKRGSYGSGGFRKFSYNGSRGARFDSLRAKVQFNESLPASLNEFPGFFVEREDSIKVDQTELVLANTTDQDNVFTIGFFGKRDPNKGEDKIESDLYVGTLQSGGGSTARQKLFNLALDASGNISGLTRFKSDTSVARIDVEGTGGELYSNSAERWTSAVDSSKLWLASEQFVIDNNGKVKNISDFINGVTDFETLLKNTAGEVGVFLKKDLGTTPDTVNDAVNFAGGNAALNNIDLVFTPDLALAIVKSLATSLDSVKNAK